jgi:hypothetical protein
VVPLSSSAELIGTAGMPRVVSSDNHASAVNLGQVVIGAPIGGRTSLGSTIRVRRVAMDLGLVAAANSGHI